MQAVKRKRCKACGELFAPFNMLQVACSPKCAQEFVTNGKGRDHAAKLSRAETRAAKKALKSKDKAYLRAKAQRAVNAYVRERDKDRPCISCGRNTGAKRNAGHYKSVGAHPELRYEAELNIHSQCEHCNSYKSGNIDEYRPRLIEKIGVEAVQWLEGPHEPKKWTIDELIEIETTFKRKLMELRDD